MQVFVHAGGTVSHLAGRAVHVRETTLQQEHVLGHTPSGSMPWQAVQSRSRSNATGGCTALAMSASGGLWTAYLAIEADTRAFQVRAADTQHLQALKPWNDLQGWWKRSVVL